MGNRVVIGTDEVGRGCLFGPVVAAAVILPDPLPDWVSEVKDSKKLSPKKREYLSNLITENCVYAIRDASAKVIDEMNILYASLYAMKQAVEAVYFRSPADKKPNVLLVDGNKTIPTAKEHGEGWLGVDLEQRTIVGGDAIDKSIGAASIIAKVYRDSLMGAWDAIYPEYGLAIHKGYGTAQHREAIATYGPCPEHRMTFGGVRDYYVKS